MPWLIVVGSIILLLVTHGIQIVECSSEIYHVNVVSFLILLTTFAQIDGLRSHRRRNLQVSSPSKGGKGKGYTPDCAPSVPPTSEPTPVGKLIFFVKLISSTSNYPKEILILLAVVLRLLKAKVKEVREEKDLPRRNALKLLPQLQLHAKIQLKDSPLTE